MSPRKRRTPFGSPKPQYVAPEYRHTTLDELEYLRGLKKRGKLDLLKTSLQNAPYRAWYGPGMDVDPIRIIYELREMIREMEAMGCK